MTGLAVDDAAWASAWRRRAPGDKVLLCGGLVVTALVLPAWPGSVLVAAVAVVLALGPARVPVRTFARAVRWPLAFVAVGAVTAVVEVGDGGIGWAPDAAARAGSLVGHALAGGAAVLLLATTTPMSDLLPALRRARVPAAVVEVSSVVYRLLFVLLDSLRAVREAQAARMGYSSLRRSYRSSGALAAAVPAGRDAPSEVQVERLAAHVEELHFGAARIRGAAQDRHAAPLPREERLDCVEAQIGIDRDRIRVIAPERLDRVLARRGPDVAALGIEDHRDAGMRGVDVPNQRFERALRTPRREVRDLRLEGAHEIGGGIDDRRAEFQDRLWPLAQARREALRIGVQPHAQQAVVLLPGAAQPCDEIHPVLPSGKTGL